MNIEKSRQLFLKIYESEKLLTEIEAYIENNKKKIEKYLKLCRKNRWELFLKKDPKMKLSLIFAFLPEVYDRYTKIGISEKIFFNTMGDIKIWINDHIERQSDWGLYELNWLMHHMNLNIFKLGRLQFQKFFYYNRKKYNKNGRELTFGCKAIYIHIPRGEKLNIEDCKKSFETAVSFFKKYFPEYSNCAFLCHSWLLYSGNRNYMKCESNIIRFSELFEIIEEKEAPSSAYLWIYGKKPSEKKLMKNKEKKGAYGFTENMPQISSLQKALTEYIEKGGSLGEALGIAKI